MVKNNSVYFKQNVLFLPAAGNRNRNGGAQNNVGSNGNYWSSTITGTNSYNLNFNSGSINAANTNNRANGLTVRCVAELDTGPLLLLNLYMEQLKIDLFQAYYDARRNKRNTINQLRFEIEYEHQLLELYEQVVNRTYTISKSIAFIVDVPVKREIFAADFRDRIIHHLIFNYINPVIEEQLIDNCYSCRKGRGTLFAIRQMEKFLKECSRNYTSDCYVLKLDIKSYFMSIDKQLLWEKLQRLLQPLRGGKKLDLDLLWWLIHLVLWNEPQDSCIIKGSPSDWDNLPPSKSLFHIRKGCGLPIGNLTSQLFSNVYLHDFDCYVKNELGVEYYGRYVDDFVLIHPDKEFLIQAKEKIRNYLKENCRLELHPNKIYLQHYRKGFAFLGAYIKPYRTYIGNRTKNKFIDTMYRTNSLLSQKVPTKEELQSIQSSVNSYLGIMKHYKTYNIRKKILLDKTHPPLILKYGYIKTQYQESMIFTPLLGKLNEEEEI